MTRAKPRFYWRPFYPKMAALYESGKSIREVAEKLGCYGPTVRLALRRQGVKARGRGGARKRQFQSPILKKAFSLVSNGYSFGQAAKELRLTRSSVAGACYRAKRWGLAA